MASASRSGAVLSSFFDAGARVWREKTLILFGASLLLLERRRRREGRTRPSGELGRGRRGGGFDGGASSAAAEFEARRVLVWVLEQSAFPPPAHVRVETKHLGEGGSVPSTAGPTLLDLQSVMQNLNVPFPASREQYPELPVEF